jgi:hypothetical protein
MCSAGSAELAALRGQLAEGIAHNTLINGGTFKMRSLEEDGEESDFKVPSLQELTFYDFADLKGNENQYCMPASRSFCAIDSLWPSENVLFQMTVSETHPESVTHALAHHLFQ